MKDLLRLSRGALRLFETTQRQLLGRLRNDPCLAQRVQLLSSIPGVGEGTALTWALEVGEPERFRSIAHATPDVPWPLFRGRPLCSHSTFVDGSKLFP